MEDRRHQIELRNIRAKVLLAGYSSTDQNELKRIFSNTHFQMLEILNVHSVTKDFEATEKVLMSAVKLALHPSDILNIMRSFKGPVLPE